MEDPKREEYKREWELIQMLKKLPLRPTSKGVK